jgi:hypothetical protein
MDQYRAELMTIVVCVTGAVIWTADAFDVAGLFAQVFSQPPERNERLTPVTIDEFLNSADDPSQTPFRNSQYVDSLIGSRVVWEGRVGNVDKLDSQLRLTLARDGKIAEFLFPDPDPESIERLMLISRGDTIRVSGVIESYKSPCVRLTGSRVMEILDGTTSSPQPARQ